MKKVRKIQPKRGFREAADNLTAIDWSFVNFKFALGLVWPVFYFQAENRGIDDLPGATNVLFIIVWFTATVIGFLISLSGLVMSAQTDRLTRFKGFKVELTGLWLFMVGPLCYFILSVGVLINEYTSLRMAHVCVCYALTSVIISRILMVHQAATRTILVASQEIAEDVD